MLQQFAAGTDHRYMCRQRYMIMYIDLRCRVSFCMEGGVLTEIVLLLCLEAKLCKKTILSRKIVVSISKGSWSNPLNLLCMRNCPDQYIIPQAWTFQILLMDRWQALFSIAVWDMAVWSVQSYRYCFFYLKQKQGNIFRYSGSISVIEAQLMYITEEQGAAVQEVSYLFLRASVAEQSALPAPRTMPYICWGRRVAAAAAAGAAVHRRVWSQRDRRLASLPPRPYFNVLPCG